MKIAPKTTLKKLIGGCQPNGTLRNTRKTEWRPREYSTKSTKRMQHYQMFKTEITTTKLRLEISQLRMLSRHSRNFSMIMVWRERGKKHSSRSISRKGDSTIMKCWVCQEQHHLLRSRRLTESWQSSIIRVLTLMTRRLRGNSLMLVRHIVTYVTSSEGGITMMWGLVRSSQVKLKAFLLTFSELILNFSKMTWHCSVI